MKPNLITFDCAQTLVDVKWDPGKFAVSCATHCGLKLQEGAEDRFASTLRRRHVDYLELNLTRDHERCQQFWDDLTADWLKDEGASPGVWLTPMKAASKYLGFGTKSRIFKVYDDVVPCLNKLRSFGIPVTIVSNWDFSLHNVLDFMGLRKYFPVVFASLEEGVEKPDPRIFQLAMKKFGVSPSDALHVGDDPIDDLQGARAAGMRAVLVNRKLPAPMAPPYIRNLNELFGAFRWND